MGLPWSYGSSLSVKFVHGMCLANVGTQAIVLRKLRCTVLLRSEQCKFLIDVSGQPIGPNFKGQEWFPETTTNHHYSLRNDREEHSSHLLRAGSLK
jgi:hypothetical protein